MSNEHALNFYHEASTYLVYRYPFIACPLLRLSLTFTDTVESASTDGRTLSLNPEFWESCTTEERVFVLAHSALHVAHMHHLRQGARDSRTWNDAADYIVNAALRDAGFKLVEGALYDARYAEWSVEEVYTELHERKEKEENEKKGKKSASQGSGPEQEQGEHGNSNGDSNSNDNAANGNDDDGDETGPDAPTTDDLDDGKGNTSPRPFGGAVEPLTHENDDGTERPLTPSEIADEEAECQLAAYQATVAEAMSGNHNASAASRIVNATSPGFDAREELREFCQRHAGRDDYDWSRPSLSFLSSANVYLPSLSRCNDLRSIVFAVDTSGSIRGEHLELMAGVIEDTLQAFPGLVARVIYADTAVRGTQEFDANSALPISLTGARGGGGTRFAPVFDYVESCASSLNDTEARPEPVALVYLTDLLASDINRLREPAYPVLWATIGRTRRVAPFGRRVDIKPH